MDHDSIHLDAAAVKVLAHPLRSRLLSCLRRDGAATATDLARALETNTGATSYHLRRLADVGLVVDTGEGDGRRRVWRAATRRHSFDPSILVDDEDAATALAWLTRQYLAQFTTAYQGWLDVEESWSPAWRDASSLDDDAVEVTAEQLAALRREIRAVVDGYREAGAGDPSARTVAVYHAAYPRDRRGPV